MLRGIIRHRIRSVKLQISSLLHLWTVSVNPAVRVLISLVAPFASSFLPGLAQLVRRVNEDLRRGDDRIGLEQELIYFKV
jgi:hypothetical protein